MTSMHGNVHDTSSDHHGSSWPRHPEHSASQGSAPCETPWQESFTRPKKQLLTKGQARTRGFGGQSRRCAVIAKEGIVTFAKEFPDNAARAKARTREALFYDLPHECSHVWKRVCWFAENAVDGTTAGTKEALTYDLPHDFRHAYKQARWCMEDAWDGTTGKYKVAERYAHNVIPSLRDAGRVFWDGMKDPSLDPVQLASELPQNVVDRETRRMWTGRW